MGVTSSSDGAYSQYELFQGGDLAVEGVRVSRVAANGEEGHGQQPQWIQMIHEQDGELVFECAAPIKPANISEDLRVPGQDSDHSGTSITWLCDPEATRKTPRHNLLRVSTSQNESLLFDFALKLSDRLAGTAISIACALSPEHLDRWLNDGKRGRPHSPAVVTSILDGKPDQAGHLLSSWQYSALPEVQATSTGSSSGKRYCAFLAYKPALHSFEILAAFSFWLDYQPSRPIRNTISTPQLIANLTYTSPLHLPHRPEFSPTSFTGTPGTEYLSPRLASSSNNRRISWQSTDSRPKRMSVQSDGTRSMASSPGAASDGQTGGFSWQQALPKRPGVQRSATSPSLSPRERRSPAPNLSPRHISTVALPQLEAIEDIPEDGPLFKAHCKSMEERAYYLRGSLKRLVKSAEAVLSASKLLDEAEDSFDHSLHELSTTSPNAIQSLNDVYWDMARRVQGFARKEGMLRLEELVIDPLKRMIVMLKAAESKRKAYEHDSKAFYEHVQKYLGVKNDTTSFEGKTRTSAADEKHKAKKDRFTISRLEYFNALRDLASFKECATLATLTHYAHSLHDIAVASGRDLDSSTAALDDLDLRLDALSAEIEGKKMEIEAKRRQTETSLAMQRTGVIGAHQQFQASRASLDTTHLSPPTDTGRAHTNGSTDALGLSISPESNTGWLQPPSPSPAPPLNRRKSSVEGIPAQLRRKEGFLWVNSRPISHQGNVDSIKQWHKSWVVLAGGQLCEYANDRLELNNQPMNLRFATAREARTQERRFAFEVITPSLRRVFQATSTEEAQAWLKTITNVIQSLLDGSSSVRHFVRPNSHEQEGSGELGLGIFTGTSKSGSSYESNQSGSGKDTDGPADGMKAVLAKLNKPLQRRTSGGHRKRDSVSSLVSNLAGNARRKDKDKDKEKEPPRTLATLMEASQSMASFFSDTKPSNPVAHSRYASGRLDGRSGARSPLLSSSEPASTSPPTTEAELDQGIEAAVNTAFGPVKPQKQSKASKDQNLRELIALLALPENRRCADCDTGDPRWASWNLGIFLCIRCSGLHRALGTHISKVRSVDLDDWSDEQLESMRDGGNKAARLIWEPTDLPREMRSDEQIGSLVKMKYVDRRWRT